MDKKLKQKYEEFKDAAAKGKKDGEFSREDKLSIMRDVYSLELGSDSEFASS